jgi:hypothetical protein
MQSNYADFSNGMNAASNGFGATQEHRRSNSELMYRGAAYSMPSQPELIVEEDAETSQVCYRGATYTTRNVSVAASDSVTLHELTYRGATYWA